jgi:hypothetical protein
MTGIVKQHIVRLLAIEVSAGRGLKKTHPAGCDL